MLQEWDRNMNQPPPRKKRLPVVGILVSVFLCLVTSAVALVLATATVSGSATLPNGSQVGITTKWGFGVSANADTTRIEAGSYVVDVDEDLNVHVNGTQVGVLEQQPMNYDLVVNAAGLRMSCAEGIVAQLK